MFARCLQCRAFLLFPVYVVLFSPVPFSTDFHQVGTIRLQSQAEQEWQRIFDYDYSSSFLMENQQRLQGSLGRYGKQEFSRFKTAF